MSLSLSFLNKLLSREWQFHSYSCIDAVQHRAARYFLNEGHYTANVVVSGDKMLETSTHLLVSVCIYACM